MKKLIFGLLFCVSVANISAQKGRNEVRAGYGVGTSNEFINNLKEMQTTNSTNNLISGDKTFKGAFQFGYKYSLTNKVNLGLALTYEWANANAFQNMESIGKLKSNYYTIAAETDYVYFRKEKFTFYSTIGAGVTIYDQKLEMNENNESSNKTNFNFQISPIGIKYGDKIGFFGEIGFGYKGLFNFGIYSSF